MRTKAIAIPFHKKVIYTVLAVLLLFLGLLGLVMPILPGILFVALAVYLLAKVSRRVERWVHGKPAFKEAHLRMESMADMSWGDRLQLTVWMAVDGLIRGVSTVYNGCARVVSKVSR